MIEKILLEGCEFEGFKIPTEHASVLLIRGAAGFLGCGYFNLAVADKLDDCVAIVSGVKTFEDMFSAKVVGVSRKASEKGITIGMTGQDALLRMVC